MKKLLISLIVTLFLSGAFSDSCKAQVQYFRSYNGPDGNYSYQYKGTPEGFSVPNGSQFYYYNGTDMNQMMNEINQLFSQFFSQNNGFNNDFYNNFGQYNQTPGIPNFIKPRLGPNSENSFVPRTPDVSPAPGYDESPDIYY